MSDLFQNHVAKSGPVECLGQTFPSDEARREHYLKLLAEKLKDPAFRKIEGFPIGSDEDILSLSDPPYYTACPNPFIEDFVRHYGKPYDSSIPYSKEPFAADVSEGRSGLFYDAHSYHTKVPHKAIMRYILYYTNPGDLVADTFCGTGMTGVAAQLCGSKSAIEELGYRVEIDGTILESTQENGKAIWRKFSKLGERKVILNDLSPAAAFIATNYNTKINVLDFKIEAERILKKVEQKLGWLYETKHLNSETKGKVNYIIWSDVFSCPECAGEIIFWDSAVDLSAGKVLDQIECPHCSSEVTKRSLDRSWTNYIDSKLGKSVKIAKQIPVLINYSIGKKRHEKKPDKDDLQILTKALSEIKDYDYPVNEIPDGDKTGEPIRMGINHVHHFYTVRNLLILSALRAEAKKSLYRKTIEFLINSYDLTHSTMMSRLIFKSGGQKPVLTGYQSGTLYFSSLPVEKNIIEGIRKQKLGIISDSLALVRSSGSVQTGSATSLSTPSSSVDYLFIDPPFGANIMYSELNFLSEAWCGIFTNTKSEAIENKTQNKDLDDYRKLMSDSFKEAYRILKPGRWMTVEFSNTQAAVWNSIQTSLQEAGFVVANVSALDKKQGSFNAVNNKTSVKQDLVISAYKPNGGLEARFAKTGGNEDSVWDFVRTHLQYLPTVKVKLGELEFISERDPRIIFDRMVAWFVRHNTPVPMSSHEFQSGLTQRFVERDGMVFLPDQVAEYDRKRLQVAVAPQMEMFVSDERSAIDWLSDFLKRRPSTYQEVSPEFMGQLGAGWKKHEAKPELSALLEDNFLKYDGTGEVPSQIHSYLSTNHKDLRGLEKNSPALVAKAKDRWYVPDPNKAQDLEKKREKALLKEFETYRAFTGRKIKESRLEVLRAGFRAAWAAKDYQTIIGIANKLPEETLQEDEKLLTLYDLALTRTEDGI
ncbi:site-specific DNA-methyltransferase [Acidithiobacillus ferrooxidans]|jgi:DNA modification methylase|uniref:site-specific DNA-methyltransferase n=1 Tax=Acidithiobacillus ferrooxidans TaxID=920 RepID=UPI00214916FE|nr:site-specific DNA-methyltransferase [Acidithiobacillus ferrooxidans]MCR1345614.1 site-specific DNA-methyltransferase [Acidithiobacillus ferrooxidans]MCR1353280.1 site-specific DNA-methyltransferase [Acidithiobacillus ferrooxidans]